MGTFENAARAVTGLQEAPPADPGRLAPDEPTIGERFSSGWNRGVHRLTDIVGYTDRDRMPAAIGGNIEKVGEVAGSMIPGIAAMAVAPEAVGPAAAMGLASGAVTGTERYQQYRAEGAGPFEAAARALPAAAVSAATGYGAGRFGTVAPFTSAPANAAAQVAGQSAISAGGQVATNAVDGASLGENVPEAAAMGAAMTVPIAAATHGAAPVVGAARNAREAVFQSEAAGKPVGKVLAPVLRATLPDSGAPGIVRTIKNRRAGRAIVDAAGRDKAFTENMKVFGELSPTAQLDAFKYLTGEVPTGPLPIHVIDRLDAARTSIDNLSQKVVSDVLQAGTQGTGGQRVQLQQTINDNLGKYVRRFYKATHLDGYLNEVRGTQAYTDAVAYYQAKGMPLDQAEGMVKAQLAEHQAAQTEANSSARGVPQTSFIRREDVPEPIRNLLGEVKDPAVAISETQRSMGKILNQHQYLTELSAATDHAGAPLFSDVPSSTSRQVHQVPDTVSMGPLAGKYTTRETFDAVMDAPMLSGKAAAFDDALDHYISKPFRWAKTVANPATHVRNIIGDTAMAEAANVSAFNPLNAKYYKMAVKALRDKNSPQFKEAAGAGATGSQMFDNPNVARDLATTEALKGTSLLDRAGSKLTKGKNTLTTVYNSEDLVFRLASYYKRRANGDTPQQAAEWTNKFFPDYEANGKLLKEYSKWPFAGPFLQFMAQVPRIAGNAALHNPAKLAAVVAGYEAFTKGGLLKDGERDDWGEARALLPDYAKGSVPFKQDGKLYVINVQNMLPGATGLEGGTIKARDVLGGGPIGEAFRLMVAGEDSFGRKVLAEDASPAEVAMAVGKKLISSQTPTPVDLLDPYSTGSKLLNANTPDQYGHTTGVGPALSNMFTGINPKVLYFDQLRYNQYFAARRALDDRLKPLEAVIENRATSPQDRIAARNEVRELYKEFGKGIRQQDKALAAAKRMGAAMGMPLAKNIQVTKDRKAARSRVRNLIGLVEP